MLYKYKKGSINLHFQDQHQKLYLYTDFQNPTPSNKNSINLILKVKSNQDGFPLFLKKFKNQNFQQLIQAHPFGISEN